MRGPIMSPRRPGIGRSRSNCASNSKVRAKQVWESPSHTLILILPSILSYFQVNEFLKKTSRIGPPPPSLCVLDHCPGSSQAADRRDLFTWHGVLPEVPRKNCR